MESYEEKSELDKYSGDACESLNDPSFDRLMWWKDHIKRYPILAKMARDVLVIPISGSLPSPRLAPVDVYLNLSALH